jgi:hypothetical protein
MSAKQCGCDPEANNYKCPEHRDKPDVPEGTPCWTFTEYTAGGGKGVVVLTEHEAVAIRAMLRGRLAT